MVIRRTDKVRELIRQDERLIERLAELSPALERLRNPEMRKVMGGVLTVEGVAEMAGLDPDVLVARLNGNEGRDERGSPAAGVTTSHVQADEQGWPPALRAMPERQIVRLDVREELRAGREPFSLIMAARREVPDGGALCLRATFEPVPLYSVMGGQGFAHFTERLAQDDWRVWFYPAGAGGGDEVPAGATVVPRRRRGDRDVTAEPGVVVLDVRGLEPPEPMVRTLEALESLPDGHTLVQLNVRVPRFLFPQLDERGFTYEVREQERDLVRVFIRRAASHAAGSPASSKTE